MSGALLAELMARLGHSTPSAAMRFRDHAVAAAMSKLMFRGWGRSSSERRRFSLGAVPAARTTAAFDSLDGMDDTTLKALALVELAGKLEPGVPVSKELEQDVIALLGDGGQGVALQLAAMLRFNLEGQGTPAQAWINEYRSREISDD